MVFRHRVFLWFPSAVMVYLLCQTTTGWPAKRRCMKYVERILMRHGMASQSYMMTRRRPLAAIEPQPLQPLSGWRRAPAASKPQYDSMPACERIGTRMSHWRRRRRIVIACRARRRNGVRARARGVPKRAGTAAVATCTALACPTHNPRAPSRLLLRGDHAARACGCALPSHSQPGRASPDEPHLEQAVMRCDADCSFHRWHHPSSKERQTFSWC